MTRAIAVLLLVAFTTTGCSLPLSARGHGRLLTSFGQTPAATGGITREYASQLPVGGRVRVALRNGESFTATFMGVEGEAIRVQKRTRVPEEPFLVPLADLAALAIDQPGSGAMNIGTGIAVGAAVGAGAAIGVLLLLASIWD